LAERGTTFSEAIVSTPQCCPSRAGYLTGQYSQNNDVTANKPGYSMLRDKREVLPAWLRDQGYETIHVGKYLNGYFGARGGLPGPGWSRWLTLLNADYQSPVWSIDGVPRADRERYVTTTINRMARRVIRRYGPRRRPFYLQIDQFAPHAGSGEETSRCQGGPVPAAGDEDAFRDARAPRNAATREADLGDKPEFLGRLERRTAAERAEADRIYGCALAALQEVDRGVAGVVSTLRETGALARTMVIFTSDNGYASLEHRVLDTKGLPYEEHLRVPLVIRPPRSFPKAARSSASADDPVANVDLAPTILELARARPCRDDGESCRRMDGRSLLPLLEGREPGWTDKRAIRTGFFINSDDYRYSCRWDGLRTPRRTLVRHTLVPEPGGRTCRPADQLELYDLRSDPFQLQGDDAVSPRLQRRLARLTRCSGIRGRDEPLPGTPFCE
jgi:arylsulfatase A-like enzyme